MPYPTNTGAKIRTYNLLRQAVSKNRVRLLSFVYSNDDESNRKKLEKLGIEIEVVRAKDKVGLGAFMRASLNGKPLVMQKYYKKRMREKIRQLIDKESFDLVHFDHLHMGQYIDFCNGIPSILDEHNIESLITKRCYENEKNLIKRRIFFSQWRKMQRYERELCTKASGCLVVSEGDKETLKHLCGDGLIVEVISNGVDINYFRPMGLEEDDNTLVFVGSMDWLPNIDAMVYFGREILPLIQKKRPGIQMFIVGKNPSARIINLGRQKEVVVVGETDDVRPFIAKSKVFVVPLRIGGGTRLKILEAFSMGKAVVSTSIGAEGIEVKNEENIVLADSKEEFVGQIIRLLDDKELRIKLSKAARGLVEKRYDWRLIGRKLDVIYRRLANER